MAIKCKFCGSTPADGATLFPRKGSDGVNIDWKCRRCGGRAEDHDTGVIVRCCEGALSSTYRQPDKRSDADYYPISLAIENLEKAKLDE